MDDEYDDEEFDRKHEDLKRRLTILERKLGIKL